MFIWHHHLDFVRYVVGCNCSGFLVVGTFCWFDLMHSALCTVLLFQSTGIFFIGWWFKKKKPNTVLFMCPTLIFFFGTVNTCPLWQMHQLIYLEHMNDILHFTSTLNYGQAICDTFCCLEEPFAVLLQMINVWIWPDFFSSIRQLWGCSGIWFIIVSIWLCIHVITLWMKVDMNWAHIDWLKIFKIAFPGSVLQ